MKFTLLLVDDHSIVRQGMSALLESTSSFVVVGEASEGKQAIEVAREVQPALIMVDLLMPNTDGANLIRTLRTVAPNSKVAVLTSSDDDDLAFSAIEAGAHAFLLKSMTGEDLLNAITRVMAEEVVIHPVITQRILKIVRSIRHPDANPFAELSDRELDVLKALANGANNARLAEVFSISVRTVKAHIGNILSKLHLNDRTEAVAFAWRNGLMDE